MTAFDDSNGAIVWNHLMPSGLNPLIVNATTGPGVIINDSFQGLFKFDANGQVVSSLGTPTPSATPLALGYFAGDVNNSFAEFVGPNDTWAATIFPFFNGSPQKRRATPTSVPASIDYQLGSIRTLSGQPIVVNGYTLEPDPSWGYVYAATGTVLDFMKKPITNEIMTVYETLQTMRSYPPDLKPSPFPPQQTGKGGQFTDAVSFYVPIPPGLPQDYFWVIKQFLTVVYRGHSYNNIRINCADKEYDHATVTDATSTPYTTCP